jgi:lipid II:glycine glycyltransferase (peptidoglycan interpeptide bridge formation enzyme)
MFQSFLQTENWSDFQREVGKKSWFFNDGKISANIILQKLPLGKSYLYIPHGPHVLIDNFQSGLRNEIKSFVTYIRSLAKEEGAVFIKMEPLMDSVPELFYMSGIKLKLSKKEIQPRRTVILDLSLSEEELLSKMHYKTRYNINLAGKKNLEIKETAGVDEFWNLMQKTIERDKFSSYGKDYYEKYISFFNEKNDRDITTKLFMAYHDNVPVAGAIILKYKDTAYYMHGASDHEHRSLMAPSWMHWNIIKRHKASGCKKYDLWGIDSKTWPGITRFKLGFGGNVVERPGSFDLITSWLWYQTYKLVRKIRR